MLGLFQFAGCFMAQHLEQHHRRIQRCAQIVRRFIDTLSTGDTACAAAVPPLRLVPRFALHAAQLAPATADAGNRAGVAQLQQANAAVMTAGDVLVRVSANSSGQGVGLRGGTFRIVHDAAAVHVTLDRVRWTEDVAVSGEIDRSAARGGRVRAKLQVTTTNGQNGELEVEWPEDVAGSSAVIRGALNGALGSLSRAFGVTFKCTTASFMFQRSTYEC